jgi:hypothetical protein
MVNNSSYSYQNFETLSNKALENRNFRIISLIAYLPNAGHRKPMALKNCK